MARNLVEHILDRHHSLRPAETAERRVRLGVRFAAMGHDAHRRQEIGVVGVHHAPVVHRAAQVRGVSAARGEHEIDRCDPSGAVESDLVLDEVIVALPGDRDVVVAVVAELHRTPGEPRCKRRRARRMRSLRLLPAEPAAHAPALDGDAVRRHAERARDLELDLGGMLRRAVDQHVAVFLREGVGNLALEIELLLAADAKAALEAVRRRGERRFPVAALERDRRDDE